MASDQPRVLEPEEQAEREGIALPRRDGIDRERIIFNHRELRDVADDAERVLVDNNVEAGVPALFNREGRVVRVYRDDQQRIVVSDVTVSSMQDRLSRVANWARSIARGAVPAFPPRDLCNVLLARPGIALPRLAGVTEVPIIRKDGSILDEAGYDEQSNYLYLPAPGLQIPEVSSDPTADQVRRAVAAIDDVFGDFPFIDDASRAAVYALLLSLSCRSLIDGPAPMLVVDAPAAGTGKGLLVQAVSQIVLGAPPEVTAAPHSDDEWRKKIISLLRRGPQLILIDNVTDVLRSAALDSVLTSDVVTDRVLGESETITLPNFACWTCTANNGQMGGDLARRIYLCRMDAQVEKPWERREFKYRDLPAHIRAHRGELVAAVLTVARAWVAAGRPQPGNEVPPLGTFEAWREVMGGMLEVAGIKNFLGNVERVHEEAASDAAEWAEFFEAWHDRLGDDWVKVAELESAIRRDEILLDGGLPENLSLRDDELGKKLGKALSARRDALFRGLKLEREPQSKRSKKARRWRVKVVAPTAPRGARGAAPTTWDATPLQVTSGQTSQVEAMREAPRGGLRVVSGEESPM